jgi:hypothetical protein
MDARTLIASRIDLQLRRHLGQPVDPYRAVHDVRYARDMLLVCDAMEGTDLPHLASQFRDAGDHLGAARRALALRPGPRTAAAKAPPASLNPGQRPVTFGRER